MLATLFFASLLFATLVQRVASLWPMPKLLDTGTDFLALHPAFKITVDIAHPPQDLLDAVSQTQAYLKTDQLIQRLVLGRGASNRSAITSAPMLSTLTIGLGNAKAARPIAEEAVRPFSNRSEGYTLAIPSDGTAAWLIANSTLGLFRGLTTFSQVWYDLDGFTYTDTAPIVIEDAPSYVSRLSTVCLRRLHDLFKALQRVHARHCEKFVRMTQWACGIKPKISSSFPVSDIKRTLDAMSWVKVIEASSIRSLLMTLTVLEDQHPALAYRRLPELSPASLRISRASKPRSVLD